MIDEGLILESLNGTERRGRRPVPLSANPDYGCFVGLDFEAKRMRVVVVDFSLVASAFAIVFFAAGFFSATFFVAAFLVAVFFAGAFFAGVFFAAGFFAVVFGLASAACSVVVSAIISKLPCVPEIDKFFP